MAWHGIHGMACRACSTAQQPALSRLFPVPSPAAGEPVASLTGRRSGPGSRRRRGEGRTWAAGGTACMGCMERRCSSGQAWHGMAGLPRRRSTARAAELSMAGWNGVLRCSCPTHRRMRSRAWHENQALKLQQRLPPSVNSWGGGEWNVSMRVSTCMGWHCKACFQTISYPCAHTVSCHAALIESSALHKVSSLAGGSTAPPSPPKGACLTEAAAKQAAHEEVHPACGEAVQHVQTSVGGLRTARFPYVAEVQWLARASGLLLPQQGAPSPPPHALSRQQPADLMRVAATQ